MVASSLCSLLKVSTCMPVTMGLLIAQCHRENNDYVIVSQHMWILHTYIHACLLTDVHSGKVNNLPVLAPQA